MVRYYGFMEPIYQSMFDNDEAWFMWRDGFAVIMYDLPIYDS